MSRVRIHKFLGTLLEKGEWNQVEAAYLHEATKAKEGAHWLQNHFRCVVCNGLLTKGTINYQYMLEDPVWAQAGFGPRDLAHLPCAEKRLGRELIKTDFMDVPMNGLIHWMFDEDIPLPKD